MNKRTHWHELPALCCGVLFGVAEVFADSQTPLAPFAFKPIEKISPVVERQELLSLPALCIAKNWRSEECEMVDEKGDNGQPQIRLHIDVDHLGGEKGYPIGWPRTNYAKPASIPWKDYDYLRIRMKMTTTHQTIPVHALYMRFRGDSKFSLSKDYGSRTPVENGKWTTITLPLTELDGVVEMSLFGFHICEKDYNHKDVVDFTFSDFELVRTNSCAIREMVCKGIVFKGEESLKVHVAAEGRAEGNAVPFEISRNGKVLRHEMLPVKRGKQTLSMDISEMRLEDGDYVLTAFPQNPEKLLSIGFRVVQSPWR